MKVLRNVTASPISITDCGVTLDALSSYTIPPQDYLLWAASSVIVTYVGAASVIVNDGSFDLTISDGIDLLKGIFPSDLIQQATNITVSMSNANIEYSYNLPSFARRVEFRVRDLRPIQLAFASGESASNYRILPAGCEYGIDGIATGHNLVFYFQSSYPALTLEITYYN